jgi:hypothetical protein
MTMNTVKIHVLAAAAALALSAGAAMAQVEGGNTYPVAPIAQPAGPSLIQSGSSDVAHPDALHSIPNWRDLPIYGAQD